MKRTLIQNKYYILLPLLILGSVLFLAQNQVAGATYTWDNDSLDGLWSTCANWSSNTCPTSSDTARFDSSTTSDSVMDAPFADSIKGIEILSGYTGTITQQQNITIDMSNTGGITGYSQADGTWIQGTYNFTVKSSLTSEGNYSFDMSGGTFLTGVGTSNFDRYFRISGGTYTSSSTRTLNFYSDVSNDPRDDSTIICTGVLGGQVDFGKQRGDTGVVISSGCEVNTITTVSHIGYVTINSGATLNLGTSLTIDDGVFTNNGTTTMSSGTISTETDFTQNGTFDLSGVTITFGGDASQSTDDSTLTCTGQLGGTINIAKGREGQTFTLASGCEATTTSSMTAIGEITNNGTLHLGSSFAIDNGGFTNNGTVTASTLTMNIERDFAQNGTWNVTTGTLIFDGPPSGTTQDTTVTCSGGLNGTAINIAKGRDGQTFVLASGCVATSTTGTMNSIHTSVTIHGTYHLAAANFNNAGDFIIGSSGSVIAVTSSNMTVDRDFTRNGTFDLGGGIISFDSDNSSSDDTSVSCSGAFGTNVIIDVTKTRTDTTFALGSGCHATATTITSSGPLTINGTLATEGNTLTGSSLTIGAGATLRRYGNETVTSPSIGENAIIDYYGPSTYTTLGLTDFEHIRFSGGGTYNLTGTYTVEDDFLSTNGSNFNQTSGTITFDGTNQTITGSSTFNNFTKAPSGKATLTFGANSTTTVKGTATLTGNTIDNYLTITSDAPGTGAEWFFDPQGSRSFTNLWVRDSNNIDATIASCTDCRNLGNNTNWDLEEMYKEFRLQNGTRLEGGSRIGGG